MCRFLRGTTTGELSSSSLALRLARAAGTGAGLVDLPDPMGGMGGREGPGFGWLSTRSFSSTGGGAEGKSSLSGLEGESLLPGEGWRPGKGGRRAAGGEFDFLQRSGGRCLGGEGGLLWTAVSAGSSRGGEEPLLWEGTTTGSSLLCAGGPLLCKGITTGSWRMLFGFKDQTVHVK